jgi:hypothetical protein
MYGISLTHTVVVSRDDVAGAREALQGIFACH